jgi:predicted DNA-binding transcriptional regulator YafY
MPININIKKALILINLLSNRDYVTLEQIQEHSGISRRTIFRYLNILSEIDIPIYYDKKVRGYRLNSYLSKSYNELLPNEILLTLVSLSLLSSQLDEKYQNQIDSLISKLISNYNYSFERVMSLLKDGTYDFKRLENLKELVTTTLIEFSINNKFPLKITYKDQNEMIETLLKKPSIEFNKLWILKDKGENMIVPIDKIEFIKIYVR